VWNSGNFFQQIQETQYSRSSYALIRAAPLRGRSVEDSSTIHDEF
jgi:hypothetical protein